MTKLRVGLLVLIFLSGGCMSARTTTTLRLSYPPEIIITIDPPNTGVGLVRTGGGHNDAPGTFDIPTPTQDG